MITYQECLSFAGLTEEEALALARLEGLTPMLAVPLGAAVGATPQGLVALRRLARSLHVECANDGAAPGDAGRAGG